MCNAFLYVAELIISDLSIVRLVMDAASPTLSSPLLPIKPNEENL